MEIYNDNDDKLISGSADSDSIINSGENVTIDSGAGSDSITLSSDGREYIALSSVTSAEVTGFESGTLDSSDVIYLVDGEIYNSTFNFKDSTITINSLGGRIGARVKEQGASNYFDVIIDGQKVRAINDSISAAFDSGVDYYALGNDSTLTSVTGTTKINDIELITNGHLTVTGKHYDLDDGSSYNLAQTITGLSGGDSITVNDLWSDATFAYYVSDDGSTISRISDDSIVYTGSADTLSSLNFGTISFMDYFTQTVGSVVDAFNTRYATFDGTTLTIDAKTLRTNLNTQIAAAQADLSTVTTVTSALVIEAMDDIIKNVISSDVSLKNLLNEDMYNALGGQIDTILSAGGDPLNIFSTLESYNGDIFSWICDSLIVPVAQILGDSTLDRLAANLADRLASHGTKTIILNGSEDTVSIGAYYGDSIDAGSSTMENLIIVTGQVTDSPQKDLILLTGNNAHSGSIQNSLVLGVDSVLGSLVPTTITGKLTYNPTGNLSITKDTTLNVSLGYNYAVNIKATDDAGGAISLNETGFTFTPDTGDGGLELSVTRNGVTRTATLNATGSVTYNLDGSIALADGTTATFAFQDGSTLKLTSHGSTGSIGFGTQGLKITSDDEKLDLEMIMAYGYSTKVSGLKGSLWYNAGKVILDEGTKLTGTGTLGSNVVNVTLETIDGDAYLDFSTSNGFVYGAGTGKLKVTYALGDRKSTFTVNEGSVLFGNGISEIAEGTDLETDLQDFMPALNLTTTDAGTYTINGQTITTTVEGLALTATDDYMTFKTSSDVVEYEGMTFAGDGTVSLSSAGVILGEGVAATGFGEGESFILAEAGNVTADSKVFELSKIEDTPREIPMIITVTGAQDGFIFSRTLTKESEAYLDDALDDESFENYTSPYIDQVFTENFISAGDNSYRIRTDAIGLQEVIGISDGATITGGAILADEPTLSYYNLITDTPGAFTIGEKTYNITGDSAVAIRARFEADTAPYASYFDSLNGTVSGDFTGHQLSINDKPVGQIFADTDITIAADDTGFKILGFDEGASLQTAEAGTYTINSSVINAGKGDIITNLNNQMSVEANVTPQTIDNTIEGALITGTDEADTITNEASDVTIEALGGDDLVMVLNASNVLVNAGEGDDVVSTVLEYSTLTGASDYSDLSVVSGDGDDTIVNWGGNNPSILSGAGNDYIVNRHGYYSTIDSGDGNDIINISNGHYQSINAGAGDDTIMATADMVSSADWAMGGHATLLGGTGDDLITPIYSNDAYIDGGEGNDTIITNGKNSTITGGAGSNLISLTSAETDTAEGVVLALVEGENSTVEGFKGVGGAEADTLYFVDGVKNKAVGFTDEGLSFWTDTLMGGSDYLSVTFTDITDTTLINLKYGSYTTETVAFINDGDIWRASLGSAKEYIGAVETPNQGVSFEGIDDDMNIALDVTGNANEFWNIHSIIGGNGNTTIKGTTSDDTLVAGTGKTTINGNGGNDVLVGNGNTTFLLGTATLKAIDTSSSKANIKTSSDGSAIITGMGDWSYNGSTIHLSNVSTVVSDANGLSTYRADLIAYETATLNSDNVYYDNGDTDVRLSITGAGMAIIGNDATGDKFIVADSSGASIENYSATANVTMIGGKGNDAFVATSGVNEYIDLKAGGKDTIAALNIDTLNVYGYDAKTGSTFLMNTHENLTNLIMYGDPYLLIVGDGYFKADNLGKVVLKGTDTLKGTFVNFTTYDDGATQLYGWSGQAGGSVDGGDYSGNAILIGVAPDGYSTLKGGSGNDTIYAAADDVVYLSGGEDVIKIDHIEREWRINSNIGGLTINLNDGSTSAKSTVKSFDTSLDKITLNNIDDLSFDFSSGDLQIAVNNSSLTFEGITDTTTLNVNSSLAAFVADNSTLSVTNDSIPARFYGRTGSLVDYSDYSGKLDINLNGNFHNVNNVRGGKGNTIIWGNDSESDAIYAGSGTQAIYGGFGAAGDSLFGYSGDDKTGAATFFALEGSGTDTIYDFEFGVGGTADKLTTFGQAMTDIIISGDDVAFQVGSDTNDRVVIKDAKNKVMQVNFSGEDWIVELGDNLTYNDDVKFYGDNSATKLKIDSSYSSDKVEVWTNGWDGKFYSNVKDIDASTYSGEALLVGNYMQNVITASTGSSSLWGGDGVDDDTLIGSDGYNEFFYLKGNGNDIIMNAKETDLINLLNVNLSDISSVDFINFTLKISFTDGGSLSTTTLNDLTFRLADGSKWQSHPTKSSMTLK